MVPENEKRSMMRKVDPVTIAGLDGFTVIFMGEALYMPARENFVRGRTPKMKATY
jgi:hypothetical protein